jgi:hypothetical protein
VSAPRVAKGQVWRSPQGADYIVVTTRPPWAVKGDPPGARLHPVGLKRRTRCGITQRGLRRAWTFVRRDPDELAAALDVLEELVPDVDRAEAGIVLFELPFEMAARLSEMARYPANHRAGDSEIANHVDEAIEAHMREVEERIKAGRTRG